MELPVPKSFLSIKTFLHVPEDVGLCGLSSWPPPEVCMLDFRGKHFSFHARLHEVKLHCREYHPDFICCPDRVCLATFTETETFKLHMTTKHQISQFCMEELWKCSTCALSFQNFASYRQHYTILHPQAAEYKFSSASTNSCRCGLKFPREIELIQHSSTTCPAREWPPKFPIMDYLPTDSLPLKPEPTPELKYLSIEADFFASRQPIWPRDSVEPPSFGRLIASDEVVTGSRLRASDELRQTLGFRLTDELIMSNGQVEASPGAPMSPVMAIKGEPVSPMVAFPRILPEWTP